MTRQSSSCAPEIKEEVTQVALSTDKKVLSGKAWGLLCPPPRPLAQVREAASKHSLMESCVSECPLGADEEDSTERATSKGPSNCPATKWSRQSRNHGSLSQS